MNRQIKARELQAIYVTGPGHGGPGLVANTYLEGTYSDVYPHVGRDEDGMRRLFRQFSFPGGARACFRGGARQPRPAPIVRRGRR
jgi:xylulose-5-phosphate/fructose-6-phosphate phosphoketolase